MRAQAAVAAGVAGRHDDRPDHVLRPPRSFRYSSASPGTPIKSIVRLRPGFRVALIVPRRQRGWLQVGYGARDGRPHVSVLQACRTFSAGPARARECRWGSYIACAGGDTLFSGGIGVDFAAAPRRGLCAELIVRVAGGRPLRQHLFAPRPGQCG